jgi:hypothetical protein
MYEAFSPAACRIAAQATDPIGVLPFAFKRDHAGAALALQFYCRPAIGRPVLVGRIREGLIRPFRFSLVATDPRAYAQAQTSTALGNLAGGNNTVTNNGNIYTNPSIEIVLTGAGAATVTITNTTTGQVFVADLSGASAGTYVLDTRRATITKAGVSVFSVRKSGFLTQMFLQPGANTITFSGNTNVSTVTFKFRDAYA